MNISIICYRYIYIYTSISPNWLRARFRRARKPHFFQYVCAMTYYIQAHHATSLHNLPKPHVWQCVCVMQFSINFIMELAYATLQHCITHVSSTFFTLSPCYMKYRWIMLKGEGGGGVSCFFSLSGDPLIDMDLRNACTCID